MDGISSLFHLLPVFTAALWSTLNTFFVYVSEESLQMLCGDSTSGGNSVAPYVNGSVPLQRTETQGCGLSISHLLVVEASIARFLRLVVDLAHTAFVFLS